MCAQVFESLIEVRIAGFSGHDRIHSARM
jgi:hypothetical protein